MRRLFSHRMYLTGELIAGIEVEMLQKISAREAGHLLTEALLTGRVDLDQPMMLRYEAGPAVDHDYFRVHGDKQIVWHLEVGTHPEQRPAIDAGSTPSREEIERARRAIGQ